MFSQLRQQKQPKCAGVVREEEGSVGGPTHILQAAENSCRTSLCQSYCHFGIHGVSLVKIHFYLFIDITTTAVWSVYQINVSPAHLP